MRFATWVLPSLFVLGAQAATGPDPPGAAEPIQREDALAWLDAEREAEASWPDGTVVAGEEIEGLRPFLPPGFFEELQFPGARLTIQAARSYPSHTSYQKATLQFAAQTSLGPAGELENYVAGLPFSIERIEAAPPDQAGLMVGWNTVHRWQYQGFVSDQVHMHFVRSGGGDGGGAGAMAPNPAGIEGSLLGGGDVERILSMTYQRVYFRHLATAPDQDYALRNAGGDGSFYKELVSLLAPFDVKGTRFVAERSVDPHEEDQVNSYLPTQRRVRRLSAKERADSFLGTQFNFDDFEGFTGRVLDYHWEYHGRKRILAVADSEPSRPRFYGPKSRAPLDRWQLRDCLVVEQRPVWEGHPYGSRLIFVDPETYNIAFALIFDREGELFKIFQTVYQWGGAEDADAPPEQTVPGMRGMAAINVQEDVATVAVSDETVFRALSARQVRRLFSVSSLTEGR